MEPAKNGDKVTVSFTLKLEDGRVFQTSQETSPLNFTIGNGEVMTGIDNGVVGMVVGDKKTIEVPPDEGFGPRREDLVAEITKSDFPEYITPEIGQRLQIKQQNGEAFQVTVTEMGEESITLDANHPLAGHTLVFDLELVDKQ